METGNGCGNLIVHRSCVFLFGKCFMKDFLQICIDNEYEQLNLQCVIDVNFMLNPFFTCFGTVRNLE